ncbi:MAG: hypothetical protein C5B48_08405 [Candidatus Rokuibacteriota bacterium]|nr:MAG: hypothetical protein C5B48_08405 [Candidatus Rokubacteria bacterium]
MSGYDESTLANRFDLYGALWAFCSRHHGGQGSRGYRILFRLSRAGYSPGIGLQQGRFETEQQADIYRALLRYREVI